MKVSRENDDIGNKVRKFEKRIEDMHQDFYRYYNGLESKVPDWQELERELLGYSRKKISDLKLSQNLDRVLYKFQNRKKIWLGWHEEIHVKSDKNEAVSRQEDGQSILNE